MCDVLLTQMNKTLTHDVSAVLNVYAYFEERSLGHTFPGTVDFYLRNRTPELEKSLEAMDFLFLGQDFSAPAVCGWPQPLLQPAL